MSRSDPCRRLPAIAERRPLPPSMHGRRLPAHARPRRLCDFTRGGAGPARAFVLALVMAAAGAHAAAAKTLEVGAGKDYKSPSAAAAAAADGDRVAIEPGEYFDCAVWHASNLVVEGTGPGVVITDKACQGKGLFVITGNNVTVRNLTLTRARVPDGNGAGIRAEGSNLTIERVSFVNNQDGILAVGHPESAVLVRDSQFLQNGACVSACAHGIYVNQVALLRIERSRFFETKEGHHIKSRALRTEVIGCDIQDGARGTSSYLIEIPNGGSLLVRDSTLEKGPKSQNHAAAIMIGAEGVSQPTREITVEGNSFRNDGDYRTVLVNNITATEARLAGNRLSGPARPLAGDGAVE